MDVGALKVNNAEGTRTTPVASLVDEGGNLWAMASKSGKQSVLRHAEKASPPLTAAGSINSRRANARSEPVSERGCCGAFSQGRRGRPAA